MPNLAQNVMPAAGWQRRFIAMLAGMVGALAMPPFNVVPAFFIPMMVAVWLLDGSAGQSRSAFSRGRLKSLFSGITTAMSCGWWLGFGYFVAGMWWLGSAFLVNDQFVWAMPLGVLGLPALLACFTALGFGLARLLWSPRWPRILALAVALGLSEWLRGHVLTGFPWNDFGMVLGANLYLAQFASLTGLYGLTVLAILIFAAPACLADGQGRSWIPVLVSAIMLAGLASFGAIRLSGPAVASVPGVRIRIMQPNVLHDLKFWATRKEELIKTYLALSDQSTSPRSTGLVDVTHLIWPESAFPFILSQDARSLADIGRALPQGTTLITGAARINGAPTFGQQPSYFNSMHVIASGGTILNSYDKVHLVPFGEYVPFGSVLRALGLQQFVMGEFSPGRYRQMLTVPGLPPVAPLICYEAIFSGQTMPEGVDAAAGRPGLFINVTDDSWFGVTPGPHQHLAQARLRSIEEGIPMIRAADTGISAIVDAFGRLVANLPLGSEGVLDGELPGVASPPMFTQNRSLASLTIWLIALFTLGLARFRV